MKFDEQDRAGADAGDDVGREHDAGEQRRDLAPQVLARVERRGQLARARARCRRRRAAGSRSSSSAPTTSREGSRALQVVQRVLDRLPEPHLLDHARAARRPPGRRARATAIRDRLRHREPGRRRRWTASAPISGSWSMNASLRLPRRRSIRRARDADRAADGEHQRQPAARTGSASTSQPTSEAQRDQADQLDRRQLHAGAGQPGGQPLPGARCGGSGRRARATRLRPLAVAARRPGRARRARRSRLVPASSCHRPSTPIAPEASSSSSA